MIAYRLRMAKLLVIPSLPKPEWESKDREILSRERTMYIQENLGSPFKVCK